VKRDFDAEALALVAAELVSKGIRGVEDDSNYCDTNYIRAISIAFELLNLSSTIASRLKELEASPQMLAMLAAKLRENTFTDDASEEAIKRAVDLWLQCKFTHAQDWETPGKRIAETEKRWAKQITLNKALMLITGVRSGPEGRKRFLEKHAKYGRADEAQRFIQEHEGKLVTVQKAERYRKWYLSLRQKRARSANGRLKKANRAEKKL
jgi:hypothetical protein